MEMSRIITHVPAAEGQLIFTGQPPKPRNKFRLTAVYPQEWEEQVWYFEWLAIAHPKIWRITHHIDNEAVKTVGEGVKKKRMGRKPGIPDVFMPHPIQPYHGLFIEFKRRCGKIPFGKQLEMMNLLSAEGFRVETAFGWEHAKQITEAYLKSI